MMAKLVLLLPAMSMVSFAMRVIPPSGHSMMQAPVIPTQANLPYSRILDFCKTFRMQDFPICKRAVLAKLDGVSGLDAGDSWTLDASVAEMPLGFFPAAGDSEAAQKAKLARLDAPTWGKAAAALASIASEAGILAAMKEACEQGAEETCDDLSREEEVKQAWLAKLDAPTWGAVALAVSEVAPGFDLSAGDDEKAKVAWLAKMDAPTWATVATAVSEVAFSGAALEEVAVATELVTEEEAKNAWLDRVHTPMLGKTAAGLAKHDTSAAWLGDAHAIQAKADLAAVVPASVQGDPDTPPTAPDSDSDPGHSRYSPWLEDSPSQRTPESQDSPEPQESPESSVESGDSREPEEPGRTRESPEVLSTVTFKDGTRMRKRIRE